MAVPGGGTMQRSIPDTMGADEELAQMPTQEDSEDGTSSEGEASNEEHPHNDPEHMMDVSTWCSCQHCVNMPSENKYKCCMQNSICRSLMAEGDNVNCITLNPDFHATCLAPATLEILMAMMHEYSDNGLPVDLSNKCYRRMAYQAYFWWAYGRMRPQVRRVMPACVVTAIRNRFPSVD